MTEVLLVLLAALVGGLVVWIAIRSRSVSPAPGPQEAAYRGQVRGELATQLDEHRKEAEASAAAARQAAQEEQDDPIEDWMARRYGGSTREPGAGDE